MFSPYVCYLRVSTHRQAEAGSSLRTQQATCLDWLTRRIRNTSPQAKISYALYDGQNNLLDGENKPFPHLPGEDLHIPMYQDGGVSGAAPIKHSPALQRALEILPSKGFLVVASLDRLSRKRLRSSYIEVELDQKQAAVLSTKGEGTDETKTDARLLADLKTALSYHERRVIRERIRDVIRQRRKDKKVIGQIPRGYVLSSDGETLEARVVPEHEVRQYVVDRFKAGASLDDIAQDLIHMPGGYRKRNGRFFEAKDLEALIEPDLEQDNPPYGYSLAPDGFTYEPRTVSEHDVIETVIERYEAGETFRAIADELRDLPGGYRTRTGRFLTPSQCWQVISQWFK